MLKNTFCSVAISPLDLPAIGTAGYRIIFLTE